MRIPKNKPWRSKQYLQWVKSQPCCMCGAPAEDAHHLIGIGGMGGMGTKAPDSMSMPVCRRHHDEIHRDPNLWPDQFEWALKTVNRALAEGVLK